MSLQSQAKEGVKRIKENPKEPRVRTKVPKAHVKGKRWSWDRLILTGRGFTRNGAVMKGTMAGVLTAGMIMGMVLNGVKDCEQTHVTSASSFSLESSEREKMNLDTRVAVRAWNFGPERIRGGRFYDWIPDGEAWQFQGYDENVFSQIFGWKTHGCIRRVEHQRIRFCISISVKSCGSRVQITTRFLCETQWWLHDSDSQQNRSGNVERLRDVVGALTPVGSGVAQVFP